jgi:hypothetical protein
MGMDSLMALELRNRLEASLGLSLSATLVWGYPTVAALAPHLAEKMGMTLGAVLPETATESDHAHESAAIVGELTRMSDADAEALLIQELESLDGTRAK